MAYRFSSTPTTMTTTSTTCLRREESGASCDSRQSRSSLIMGGPTNTPIFERSQSSGIFLMPASSSSRGMSYHGTNCYNINDDGDDDDDGYRHDMFYPPPPRRHRGRSSGGGGGGFFDLTSSFADDVPPSPAPRSVPPPPPPPPLPTDVTSPQMMRVFQERARRSRRGGLTYSTSLRDLPRSGTSRRRAAFSRASSSRY